MNDPRFFVTHRLSLATGILAAGYEVHVATPRAGYENFVETIRQAGILHHDVGIERQGLNPLADARGLLQLILLYRKLRPSLVHHVTVKPVLYGTIAARIAGVSAVVNAVSGLGRLFHTTGKLGSLRSRVVAALYSRAMTHPNMCVIFQNDEDLQWFVREGIVARDKSILIEGSGTELQRFNPEAVPDDPPIVLVPARLLKQKGILEFAAAAHRLRTEGSNARFAIAGDQAGNRDAIPDSEIERIKAEGSVELWGWVTDIPVALARASIICLPSYHEGASKALIDGCAAGRPLIASNVAGCQVAVVDGINGVLIPPRDAQALATAMRRLLQDPGERARMGLESRRLAERKFGVKAVTAATLNTYRQLLGRP